MKRYSLFTILLSLLLVVSCTLSMEEFVVPEEEQGFEEPVTEEFDFGEITFQLNEDVQRVTENVQEYIVAVKADTILYFAENTPEKWMPQVGKILFAEASRLIPMALGHRVLSVTKENGMYKVVVTQATKDEVFKDLQYEIDMDYLVPEIPMYDSLQIDSMQQAGVIDTANFCMFDFSLLDSIRGRKEPNRPALLMRKTRDDAPVPVEDSQGDSWDNTLNYEFELSNIPNCPAGLKDVKIFVNGRWYGKETIHFYEYEDKARDYRRTWQEEDREDHVVLKLGGSFSKGVLDYEEMEKGKSKEEKSSIAMLPEGKLRENWPQIKQELDRARKQWGEKWKDRIVNKNASSKLTGPQLRVPLPYGLFFVLKFEPNASVTGLLYGTVSASRYSEIKREEIIYEKGEKKTITHDPTRKAYSTLEAAVAGEMIFEIGARFSAGIEHVSGIGAEVGFSAGVKLDLNWQHDFTGDTYVARNNSSYADLSIPLTVDGALYFSPAGNKLAEGKFIIWSKSIKSKHWQFNPELGENLEFSPKVVTYNKPMEFQGEIFDNQHQSLAYYANLVWKSFYWFDVLHSKSTTSPFLRVYKNKTAYESMSKDYKDFYPGLPDKRNKVTFETNKEYKVYVLPTDLPESWEAEKWVFVPALDEWGSGTKCEFRDKVSYVQSQKNPKISVNTKNVDGIGCPVWQYLLKSRDMEYDKNANPSSFNMILRNNLESYFKSEFGVSGFDQYYYWSIRDSYKFSDTEAIDEWGLVYSLKKYFGDTSPKKVRKKMFARSAGEDFCLPGKKTITTSFVGPVSWLKAFPQCHIMEVYPYVVMNGVVTEYTKAVDEHYLTSNLKDEFSKTVNDGEIFEIDY